MSPHGMESPRDTLLRHVVEVLNKDGYARGDPPLSGDYIAAFHKMRSDAAEHRKRPTVATGRETALAFLKATVEDVHKTMAERTEAARTLLMHSSEAPR